MLALRSSAPYVSTQDRPAVAAETGTTSPRIPARKRTVIVMLLSR